MHQPFKRKIEIIQQIKTRPAEHFQRQKVEAILGNTKVRVQFTCFHLAVERTYSRLHINRIKGSIEGTQWREQTFPPSTEASFLHITHPPPLHSN